MDIVKLTKVLKSKGYDISFFEDIETASIYLNQEIDNKTVGFGDSQTLTSMKMFESLSTHNKVFDPQNCKTEIDFLKTAKKCLNTEIFITSVNALAETGEIINIDGTGNRIAGSIFGHEKVYFIVGLNKLVDTLENAVLRARNIAAPHNAMRLGVKTPCAKNGNRCFDCLSKERICNGMMIYFRKMDNIKMEIILINENLGY